jgi:hypothetical protein
MPKASRYIEQNDSLQESIDQKLRVRNGGRIEGTEGGLRIDVFDHDENSEYDFTESDCSVCELPEHAQNNIISDIEYEENA